MFQAFSHLLKSWKLNSGTRLANPSIRPTHGRSHGKAAHFLKILLYLWSYITIYIYIYCKTIFHFGHHCATSISPHQSSHRVCFSDSWVTSIVVAFISMLLSSNVTWPKSYQFPTLSTCRGPGSSVCPSVSWNFQVFLSALSVRLWWSCLPPEPFWLWLLIHPTRERDDLHAKSR